MKTMKWTRYVGFLIVLLTIGLVACEVEETEIEAPEPDVTAVPVTGIQELQNEIDTRLNEVNQHLSALTTQVSTMPEEAREEIESEIAKIGEEKEDIIALQQELNTAVTPEEVQDIEGKVWEEFRDLDMLITEARLEAAQERADFQTILEEELADFDREISELEAEAATVDAETQQVYNERITELRQQRALFQEDLEQFEQATDETWMDLRTGLIQGWQEVKEGYYDIRIPDVDVNVETQDEL